MNEIFAALTGAAIALIVTYSSNRHNHKMLELQLADRRETEKAKIVQERLEELHVSVSHWLIDLTGRYLNLKLVMEGHITYDKYNDGIIESGVDADRAVGYQRIDMIIGLHAPALMPRYKRVMEAIDDVNEIVSSHKVDYNKHGPGCDGTQFLEEFRRRNLKVQSEGTILKEEIAKLNAE